MNDRSAFRQAIHNAMLGAKAWFIWSCAIGLSVVFVGIANGVSSHKAYASALLLPFFLAALHGTVAIARFRHRIGAAVLDGVGRQLLGATLGWSSACMSLTVLVDWAAARAGMLGRGPSDFLDSSGMVVVTSLVLAGLVALPYRESK
jgi:hypothetical protein